MQSSLIREGEVFFKQWLRSPKSMGSILPSSQSLARALANEVAWKPGQYVVELGGGTGAITQGLIERGIPKDRVIVVELETHLFEYLRDRFPESRVIQGDATRLDEILAHHEINDISTVISGLPMVGMPRPFQKAIVDQAMAAMKQKGFMLQYTYSPIDPLPSAQLNVRGKLARFVLWNLPPAHVWKYSR